MTRNAESLSLASALSLVAIAVIAGGCIDAGPDRITTPLYVAGTQIDAPIVGLNGAQIELDRADVAFGPLYLCAGAQAGELCETARLEWLDSVAFDALDPAAVAAGELSGYEGTVRSWMFDLGVVSLLTQPDPLVLSAAEQLGDASVQLAGRAIVDGVTIPFRIALVVAPQEQTEAGVPAIRKSGSDAFGHELNAAEPGLLIRFDARPWVTQIDFASLLEDETCETSDALVVCAGQVEQICESDGSLVESHDCGTFEQVCVRDRGCVERVEFDPESQAYRAVRNQVVAGPRPSFEWGFTP